MLGKFDSYRDSALHFLCSAEWSNDSFGDVTEYGGYVWRISNDFQDVQVANTEVSSMLEDWFSVNGISETDESFRRQLIGHFIVLETSQGLVTVKEYPSGEALMKEYSRMEQHFNEWLEATTDEENN